MSKSTGELLSVLKKKSRYTEFFKEEVGELDFSSVEDYLNTLLTEKGLKKSAVINRSGLERSYAYQIFNGTKVNPSRNKILMLALGMSLSFEEAQKLLKICRLPLLYVRDPRDSIIIFAMEKRMNLINLNELLSDYGLELLE